MGAGRKFKNAPKLPTPLPPPLPPADPPIAGTIPRRRSPATEDLLLYMLLYCQPGQTLQPRLGQHLRSLVDLEGLGRKAAERPGWCVWGGGGGGGGCGGGGCQPPLLRDGRQRRLTGCSSTGGHSSSGEGVTRPAGHTAAVSRGPEGGSVRPGSWGPGSWGGLGADMRLVPPPPSPLPRTSEERLRVGGEAPCPPPLLLPEDATAAWQKPRPRRRRHGGTDCRSITSSVSGTAQPSEADAATLRRVRCM